MKSTICLTSAWGAIAVLCLPSIGAAQVGNNSYARMVSNTNSLMQHFTTQQRQYLGRYSSASPSPSTSTQPAQGQGQPVPIQPQYQITATDFQGAQWREFPARMLVEMKGVTPLQKTAIQQMYDQIFSDYEHANRPGNVACAMAYAIRISLEIDRGQKLSQAQSDSMIRFLNDALANTPQFNAMTPQQKQILYEASILSGGIAAILYVNGQQQSNPAFQLQARDIAKSVLREAGI
jgi:hypothetical protein